MKIYCCRFYLGEHMVTESYYRSDNPVEMEWLEDFKRSAREHSNPYVRSEITTLVVEGTETIYPDNPATPEELGIA